MSIPIKKTITVKEAKYVKEADSLVLVGECEEGQIRHQIHSNSFYFGNKNKEIEMQNTANLMIGKKINIVFDTELNEKIKDHYPLKY